MANQRHVEHDMNETIRKEADQTAQTSRAMSAMAERASRAAALRRNADAFSSAWRTSSEAASQIAERSMEQFSKLLGLSGDKARESVQESAATVQELLDTSTTHKRHAECFQRMDTVCAEPGRRKSQEAR